ncbi:adenylate/guanylate cyclase [Shimia gijangensis]|uniref:Adenylate/guanylate cyclase n=1 Tax=Shimia gijangensis TaxID=1470563 RepID=A0A1M6CUP1_9RHOB|nr:adenylate/guanylate cyclase domain-containing protein [Shimia gijangensis]SHI64680.1 adenylate/guanylate cyclase [Shimia gijangensis]
MANTLWRGNLRTRLRIASGLVLFTYVFFHFVNIALGLHSIELMERFQDWRQVITRSGLGGLLLYSALLTHAGLALYRLARRRTLRMSFWEGLQICLGLTIPLLLMVHFIHTRAASSIFGVNDEMGYITALIWNTISGWNQALLLLIVWTHGCTGLHFWLRGQGWWRATLPWLIGLASLVPTLALAGFLVQGRAQSEKLWNSEAGPALMQEYGFPTRAMFARLEELTNGGLWVYCVLLGSTAITFLTRRFLSSRGSVSIRYIDGPEIQGKQGMTLLEMSRASNVPHMALCGGRGRCTTCRVIIEEGGDLLHPPLPEEQASLQAVNAPPNARLACQLRPTNTATVLRVFRADGRRARAHESLGQERRLAILFLDMRSFTARTTGQLPYDVVFLLNRFFDAIVPSITGAGGSVDKYLGDGLLAVFELDSERSSARAALEAAAGISSALQGFNKTLLAEKADPVRIGMGVHLGELVLGEIGAAENAPRTIIGDTVNATSRLEAKTKELGVEALISADLLRAAGHDTTTLELIALTLRGVAHEINSLSVSQASDLPVLLGSPSKADT